MQRSITARSCLFLELFDLALMCRAVDQVVGAARVLLQIVEFLGYAQAKHVYARLDGWISLACLDHGLEGLAFVVVFVLKLAI